jgi:hypothetical protein
MTLDEGRLKDAERLIRIAMVGKLKSADDGPKGPITGFARETKSEGEFCYVRLCHLYPYIREDPACEDAVLQERLLCAVHQAT